MEELPDVRSVVNVTLTSLSRAGRNEAAHKSTSRALKESAVSSQLTPRKPKSSTRDLTEYFEANAFGEQQTEDLSNRAEMCSSPRLHPQRATHAAREYRAERLQVFSGLHHDIPHLSLVDVGGLSAVGQASLLEGHGERDLDDEFDTDSVTGSYDQDVVGKGSQQDTKEGSADGARTPAPNRRSPRAQPTAAFLSPSRWKEEPNWRPPVGHYRPKFTAVERRAPNPAVLPLHASTARAKPHVPEPLPPPLPAPQSARVLTSTQAPRSPSANEDLHSPGLKSGQPSMHNPQSSPSFKSRTARSPPRAPAAPDPGTYWPINEALVTTPPRGTNFSKMRGRNDDDFRLSTAAPDAVYNLPSALNERSPVRMDRQLQRPVPARDLTYEGSLRVTDVVPNYDTSGAAQLKFARSPVTSFDSSSPRRELLGKADLPTTVSVDAVEKDITAILRSEKSIPSFEKALGRPKAKLEVNDLNYIVDDSLIYPRIPHALLRPDGAGHRPLFEKRITDNCSYNPDANATKPKLLRNIDFAKLSPRLPPKPPVVDASYQPQLETISPRVRGNPMMGQHISRSKRNKLLNPKPCAPDVMYNIRPVPLHLPNINFAKCVTRAGVFKGRGGPSDHWLGQQPETPGPGAYFETSKVASSAPRGAHHSHFSHVT